MNGRCPICSRGPLAPEELPIHAMLLHGRVIVEPRPLQRYQAALLEAGAFTAAAFGPSPTPARPCLEEVVARQLVELSVDVAGPAPVERARPEADLSRYADALDVAIRTCPHDDVQETLYHREWQCLDCGRYFDRAGLRAAVRDRQRGDLG